MSQQVVVLFLVFLAVIYLGRKARIAWRSLADEKGCKGCGCAKPKSPDPITGA